MIKFRIEGDADGEWHLLDRQLGPEGDHIAHRDMVVRALRDMNIARYRRVRLVKVITTTEVIGEVVDV